MSERTPARYDEIVDFYDSVVGETVADPATAGLLNLLGEVREARLLDLACGQGRIARELARRGAQVIGADISEALLDKARAAEKHHRLGITYVQVDVTAPNVLDGKTFDGVVCNHGLSDIDHLDAALATVARVLQPTVGSCSRSFTHASLGGVSRRRAAGHRAVAIGRRRRSGRRPLDQRNPQPEVSTAGGGMTKSCAGNDSETG